MATPKFASLVRLGSIWRPLKYETISFANLVCIDDGPHKVFDDVTTERILDDVKGALDAQQIETAKGTLLEVNAPNQLSTTIDKVVERWAGRAIMPRVHSYRLIPEGFIKVRYDPEEFRDLGVIMRKLGNVAGERRGPQTPCNVPGKFTVTFRPGEYPDWVERDALAILLSHWRR